MYQDYVTQIKYHSCSKNRVMRHFIIWIMVMRQIIIYIIYWILA